jgi:glycosyltransferase involved in cell wall biosynthesis
MRTVLDAAAIHHTQQDRTISYYESPTHHREICQNKDAEVALADLVITCSEYAKATYVAAGVPERKIAAIPLGVDLDLFFPQSGKAPRSVPTLLFVGATSHRKGIDLLCQALCNIADRGREVELLVVGPASDNHSWVQKAEPRGRVHYRGSLSQDALADEYRAADCLVLPSRHDSFGMVVAEALACGVPAIVSSEVGAKALIKDGVSGWIVPAGDVEALEKRIEWCVDNIDQVRSMSSHARVAAEKAGWVAYRKRIHEVFGHFLADYLRQS